MNTSTLSIFNKSTISSTIGSLVFVASLGLSAVSSSFAVEGKFVPRDGKKLLIIGQDNDSVRNYVSSDYFPEPGGVTNYTSLFSMLGVIGNIDYGSGTMNLVEAMFEYTNSALVIGLDMTRAGIIPLHAYDDSNEYSSPEAAAAANNGVDGLDGLLAGVYDLSLEYLEVIAKHFAPRPIFLRIGYEFDGPWNEYEPTQYVAAYRYVVDYLNEREVDNIAFVWQTSNWGENPVGQLNNWYPGDEYVDWMGFTFFFYDQNFNGAQIDEILSFSREKNKPLIIAETSAQFYDFTEGNRFDTEGSPVESVNEEAIWNVYFKDQLFKIINENDNIRAMAWINADWRNQPQWACCENGFWGDTRIEETQVIRDNWIAEINDGTWVHGTPDLLEELNIVEEGAESTSPDASSF